MDRIMTAVGLTGGVLILCAYYLISKGMLAEWGEYCHGMYFVGSILLTADLCSKRAWAGAALNLVFAGIAGSAFFALFK